MKKRYGFWACVVAVFILVGCGDKPATPVPAFSTAELPNPVVEYDTLEAAVKDLGFEVKTPTVMPYGFAEIHIELIDGKILQLIYEDPDKTEIVFRTGEIQKNIGGNYNEYPNSTFISTVYGDIVLKGNSGSKYNFAQWNANERSYSLFVELIDGTGVSQDIFMTIINDLK